MAPATRPGPIFAALDKRPFCAFFDRYPAAARPCFICTRIAKFALRDEPSMATENNAVISQIMHFDEAFAVN
jgi:hypothetical protein